MKKLNVIITIAILVGIAYAQEQTLLGGEISNGGYGSFYTKAGQINGKASVFMGGQGTWIMNHRLGLGGKGYALISPTELPDQDNVKLEFGCWGGLIEYIIASNKLIHLNLHTMIGAGGVRYSPIDYNQDHPGIDYSEDALFVVEPGIDAELNVNRNFRIALGISYRIVSGVDYADLTAEDLNGITAQLVFKFGVF